MIRLHSVYLNTRNFLMNFSHLLWKWLLHKKTPLEWSRDVQINENVTGNAQITV